jgi:DNA-binding GntR family transcriptional regulator
MPIPTTPSPALCRRLHRDEVFELVLDAIVSGELAEGERLRDTELEDWLGVSRTPIRMALARLEDLSLIETVPKKYTRVSIARPWLVRPLLPTLCSLVALALAETLADDETRVAVAAMLRRSSTRASSAGPAAAVAPAGAAAAAPAGAAADVAEEARVASPTVPPVVEALVSAARAMAAASTNGRLEGVVVHFGVAMLFHARFVGDDLDEARLGEGLSSLGAALEAADLEAARTAVETIASSACQ